MTPADETETSVCAQCGEELWPELERAFTFGDDQVLCFECAIARGGIYNERKDRWMKPPNVTGLVHDEEHAHTPPP